MVITLDTGKKFSYDLFVISLGGLAKTIALFTQTIT
jgi:hypothetical protein